MNFSLLFFSFFFVFCHSLKLHQELGVQEAFSLKANLNFTGAEEGKKCYFEQRNNGRNFRSQMFEKIG